MSAVASLQNLNQFLTTFAVGAVVAPLLMGSIGGAIAGYRSMDRTPTGAPAGRGPHQPAQPQAAGQAQGGQHHTAGQAQGGQPQAAGQGQQPSDDAAPDDAAGDVDETESGDVDGDVDETESGDVDGDADRSDGSSD